MEGLIIQPYKYGKSKLVIRHSKNQSSLIRIDSSVLLDKEARGVLKDEDVIKFKLLLGRNPTIGYNSKLTKIMMRC